MKLTCLALALTCAELISLTGSAAAEAPDLHERTRIYGGAWLGFGGDAELDHDASFVGTPQAMLGGQVGMDFPTFRLLSLGFEGRFGAAKWERLRQSTKLIDLTLKPRCRFVSIGRFELYGAVPVGVTINQPIAAGEERIHVQPVGFNVGGAAGANLFLSESFGLNAEPVWLYHYYRVEGPSNDFALKQFSVMVNAIVAL